MKYPKLSRTVICNMLRSKLQIQLRECEKLAEGIAREVLDAAAHVIRPGITTNEIDAVVHEATIAADQKLEDGDIVNVDVTVCYKGVHGDLNETFFVGNVDEASKRLVHCTNECLEKAIAVDMEVVVPIVVQSWKMYHDTRNDDEEVVSNGKLMEELENGPMIGTVECFEGYYDEYKGKVSH
ncbi:Microtubule-associated protein 1A [Orobanche minor]